MICQLATSLRVGDALHLAVASNDRPRMFCNLDGALLCGDDAGGLLLLSRASGEYRAESAQADPL